MEFTEEEKAQARREAGFFEDYRQPAPAPEPTPEPLSALDRALQGLRERYLAGLISDADLSEQVRALMSDSYGLSRSRMTPQTDWNRVAHALNMAIQAAVSAFKNYRPESR